MRRLEQIQDRVKAPGHRYAGELSMSIADMDDLMEVVSLFLLALQHLPVKMQATIERQAGWKRLIEEEAQ